MPRTPSAAASRKLVLAAPRSSGCWRRPRSPGAAWAAITRLSSSGRAAGRNADYREPRQPEGVGELAQIDPEIEHRPARRRVRAADPGPADGDVAHADLSRKRFQIDRSPQRRADRPVAVEHREPIVGAGLGIVQTAAVGETEEVAAVGRSFAHAS
jgi:hypothetical protein